MVLNTGVRYGLIGVITFIWVMNLISPIFLTTYKPDPSVNAIFMIVIGALFGEDAVSRVKNKNNNKSANRKEDGADES